MTGMAEQVSTSGLIDKLVTEIFFDEKNTKKIPSAGKDKVQDCKKHNSSLDLKVLMF